MPAKASKMKAKKQKSLKTEKKDVEKQAAEKDSRIDQPLLEKAVTALIKYHNEQVIKKEEEKEKLPLLGTDLSVQVQFGLEVAPGNASFKPFRVPIPHPIHKVSATEDDDQGLDEPEVCLIVKEGSKPWVQEMIEEFQEHMRKTDHKKQKFECVLCDTHYTTSSRLSRHYQSDMHKTNMKEVLST